MILLDNAQKDSLTLCYTKDSLWPFLEKMRAEYSAYRNPFTTMVIDIDGFKSFNDRYGHVPGDEALKYFASSLRLNLEDEDCVIIRFGGDEFVIVFPERTAKETYSIAGNMQKNIKRRPFLFRGREYKFSFSGGIASCPADAIEPDELIEKADKAMYFSKHHHGGRITQYSKMWFEVLKTAVKVAVICAIIAAIIALALPILNMDIGKIINEKIAVFKSR